MTKLEQKLKAAIRRFGLAENDSVVVAVSGGLDSVALLDALIRLRQRGKLTVKLFVAHLNHQLRGEESDGDEAFVRRLAAEREVDCLIERIAVADVALVEKQNLEATARRLRYEFLTRAAEKIGANFVCTAHTLDDQAETILMRLLRGTGAEGLAGIHAVRPLGQSVKLIRPLLAVTREEVSAHCHYYNLEFRHDSSNDSLLFTRNRIRHELLPMLKSFNPRVNQTLARLAELLADDETFLRQTTAEALAEARQGEGLSIKRLMKLQAAIRRRVLRQWLKEVRGGLQRIEAVHLSAIERLIAAGKSGRIIELPGGWQVRRKSGVLEIVRVENNAASAGNVVEDGGNETVL